MLTLPMYLGFMPGGDLGYEATTGERPKKGPMEKLMGSYLEDLMKLSIRDLAVFKSVQEVCRFFFAFRTLVP